MFSWLTHKTGKLSDKKSKCLAGSHTKLENSVVVFIPSDTELQPLVYDILSPAASTVIDYATGL